MNSKICKKCGELKPLTEFTIQKDNKDGFHNHCKSCKQKTERDYFHNNDHAREKRAVNNRRFKYGISTEDYYSLLETQGYCCAICGIHLDEQTWTTIPRVDHCHDTSKVRGLLCGQCNVGIGHFYENEDSLLAAVDYLRKHK